MLSWSIKVTKSTIIRCHRKTKSTGMVRVIFITKAIFVDRVVYCFIYPESLTLKALVENVQIHKHTITLVTSKQRSVLRADNVATVSCAAFYLIDPNSVRQSDIDYILIIGDIYYHDCLLLDSELNLASP